MSKRPAAAEEPSAKRPAGDNGDGASPVAAGKRKQQQQDGASAEQEGMGEFEDAFEDELEEEEFDDGEMSVDGEITRDDEDDEEEDDDEEEEAEDTKVYLPSQHPDSTGVQLEPDQSAYEMLHRLNVTWPCLSFDILPDSLGSERAAFPHTAYFVAGTQADQPKNNEVLVMKASSMHRTNKDGGEYTFHSAVSSQ